MSTITKKRIWAIYVFKSFSLSNEVIDFQNKLNALIHFLPQYASRYKNVVQNELI